MGKLISVERNLAENISYKIDKFNIELFKSIHIDLN